MFSKLKNIYGSSLNVAKHILVPNFYLFFLVRNIIWWSQYSCSILDCFVGVWGLPSQSLGKSLSHTDVSLVVAPGSAVGRLSSSGSGLSCPTTHGTSGSWPGIEPFTCTGRRVPNHRATREIPDSLNSHVLGKKVMKTENQSGNYWKYCLCEHFKQLGAETVQKKVKLNYKIYKSKVSLCM